MSHTIHHHVLKNGLTLLAQPMPNLRSVAVNILIPAGYGHDPGAMAGMSNVLAEMIQRGAGKLDSKELSLAMDAIGLDRNCSSGTNHMRIWGATLARNLPRAIELFSDLVQKPLLPKEELAAVKQLSTQEILSLEDEPRQKVLLELRKRHFGSPLGNDRRGTAEGIKAITHDALKKFWKKYFRPNGAIISVAGNIEWKALVDLVEKAFGKWKEGDIPHPKQQKPLGGYTHIPKETQQLQIGIAYPSVPFGHKEFYSAIGAVNVLSGGMSSRLFTEVREKRGLCYSVWASHQNFKEVAAILCYAGTTTEQAQDTLNVTLGELEKLSKGIKEDEVRRLKVGLKSSILIAEESSSARANSIAVDWYFLGRVRTIEEIQKAIDSITPQSILDHVKKHPAKNFTIVTLGAKKLTTP